MKATTILRKFSAAAEGSKAKSLYDVLGIKKTASKKEIRNAFVALSKLYHPDSSNCSTRDDKRFIKLAEAYKVLSNADSRRAYDYSLLRKENPSIPPESSVLSQFYRDGTIYTGPKDPDQKKPRFTNSQVVIGAVVFAVVGGFLQLYIVKYFSEKRAESQEKKHLEALTHINKIRSLSAMGQTSVQMNLADYRDSLKRKTISDKETPEQ